MAKRTVIIADIGINHGGDANLAKKLIQACVYAGVDVIKFQTVNADAVYKKDDPLYEIFKKVELSLNDWIDLKNTVVSYGKEFLSTPGDTVSADMLNNIGVERFKIASDSAGNLNFVNYVASFKKPYILSTGMLRIDEVEAYVNGGGYNTLPEYVLHCVSNYPTQDKDAGLSRITQFKNTLKPEVKIGYSDHVRGYDASLAAVAMGAELIEKHIKFDDSCVDASVSLAPLEFKDMIDKIRKLEEML